MVLDWRKTVAIWFGCAERLRLMGCVGLAGSTFSIWFSSRAALMGWGYPKIGSPRYARVSLKSSVQVPI